MGQEQLELIRFPGHLKERVCSGISNRAVGRTVTSVACTCKAERIESKGPKQTGSRSGNHPSVLPVPN